MRWRRIQNRALHNRKFRIIVICTSNDGTVFAQHNHSRHRHLQKAVSIHKICDAYRLSASCATRVSRPKIRKLRIAPIFCRSSTTGCTESGPNFIAPPQWGALLQGPRKGFRYNAAMMGRLLIRLYMLGHPRPMVRTGHGLHTLAQSDAMISSAVCVRLRLAKMVLHHH
jgi:hypothetical protein